MSSGNKLTLHQLRYAVGLSVLVGHVSSICLYWWLLSGTNSPTVFEYADGVSVLAPFTLLYAGVFYRYVVANPVASSHAKQEEIDLAPFLIQFIMVIVFICALHFAIFWAFANLVAVQGASNISVILGAIDSMFALFIGSTFSSLFPLQWEVADRQVVVDASDDPS